MNKQELNKIEYHLKSISMVNNIIKGMRNEKGYYPDMDYSIKELILDLEYDFEGILMIIQNNK